MLGVVLNTAVTRMIRKMPLSLDNILRSTVFRFGSTDDNKISFSCLFDSFDAMNTVSMVRYMWIITMYPDILFTYEQYDDADPF